jgi:hypothetical protein
MRKQTLIFTTQIIIVQWLFVQIILIEIGEESVERECMCIHTKQSQQNQNSNS